MRKPDEEGARVNDIAVSPDGRRLVVLLDHRILVYDLPSLERIYEWPADGDKLTSVNISSQHPNLMLVSMSDDRIKLIEIDTGYCIQTYMAHSQRQFIIRSCFGGANEAFVVSGSEGTCSCLCLACRVLNPLTC